MFRFLMAATLVLSTLLVIGSNTAIAQKHPAAVIAIWDSQRVFRESKGYKSVSSQISTYVNQLKEIQKREVAAVRKKEDDLRKQISILSPEARSQRERKLREDVAAAQRRVQERRVALDNARRQGAAVLEKQILVILKALEKERGINLVFDRNARTYHGDSLDITAEIIKRLDKAIPSVKVAKPKGF